MSPPPDELLADLVELGGAGLATVELTAAGPVAAPEGEGVVRLGVHRAGALPQVAGLDAFDILLTSQPDAPRPWVSLAPERLDAAVARLEGVVAAQPVAAAVAAQLLRTTLGLPFDQALAMESLGYSMLLASDGFRAWRAANLAGTPKLHDEPRVSLSEDAHGLSVRMVRPKARNAVDSRMRDALYEAFEFAELDPDRRPVVLSGAGACFSVGGDLAEFGTYGDAGRAHLVRVLRLPARLIWRIRGRVTAKVHRACVGAGVEMPSAAGRVIAAPNAWFRLPEVAMGLIPGAGGTAAIPRRIGRRRACYMAISGLDIDARTALDWGLVDAVETFA
jgi:enoyl-CoA hydratase/carnithine racemase